MIILDLSVHTKYSRSFFVAAIDFGSLEEVR